MTTTDRASACLALVELSLLIKIVTPNAFHDSPSAIIRYRVNVGAGAPLRGIKRFGSNIFRTALSIAFLWPSHRTSLGTGPHLTLTPYWSLPKETFCNIKHQNRTFFQSERKIVKTFNSVFSIPGFLLDSMVCLLYPDRYRGTMKEIVPFPTAPWRTYTVSILYGVCIYGELTTGKWWYWRFLFNLFFIPVLIVVHEHGLVD